jgi:hypothetical protein
MAPRTLVGRRLAAAWRRLHREEEGVALVLVIVTMLVLTITLSTVMFMTAAGARDAHRSNAGQKASALAESGINNALAVLNANYPGATVYPGNPSLLPARTTTSTVGSVTWSGTLENVPTNPSWKWQWKLSALGSVKNPTGPGAGDVVRRASAVVPVVIPESTSVPPGTTATDWIYALNDVTFGQSVNVAAPVYAGRDLILENSATISETIPASLTLPARPNRIAVGHNLSLVNPQNQVGHVNGTASPANDLSQIHVVNQCASKADPTPHACTWGNTDKIWGVVHDNVIPAGYLTKPELTCCSPVNWAAPANGLAHPASPTSYMGFWYLNAGLGPKSPAGSTSGSPPRFDTLSGVADDTINQSAYSAGSPFDLTGNTSYSVTSADGQTKLAWDKATSTLTIKGNVFIDGSVQSTATNAKYVGKGTIILSGLFTMDNNTALCANLQGSACSTSEPWDADTTALAIVADGIDLLTGDSIAIKKGNFQGLLLGNGDVDASVSGTLVIGPMVSVYGSVDAGQSGTLQFPPITFASSGTDGLTGPLPLPQLLPPIQFGGG